MLMIQIALDHRSLRVKHPTLIKLRVPKRVEGSPEQGGNARVPNNPPLDLDTQDEDILIADQNDPQDDSDYPVGPDE